MYKKTTKPFRVAIDWLYYAHDHEKTSSSRELMNKVDNSVNKSWIQTFYAVHVREIVSVAELYTSTRGMVDEKDIALARRAQAIVARGKKWLKEHDRS